MIVSAIISIFEYVINIIKGLLPNIPLLPDFVTEGFSFFFSMISGVVGIIMWFTGKTAFLMFLDLYTGLFVWINFKRAIIFIKKYLLFWK